MMLWTATSSARDAMDVVLLRPPQFEGRKCKRSRQRSGYSAVSLSGSRRRCGGQYCPPSPAQATLRVGVLPEVSVLPGRYRSLRLVASSKRRTDLVTPRSSAATAQQLRQLGEVRRQPPRLVARQPIWSPSDATQRYVRNRGRSGSARLALETTLMTRSRPRRGLSISPGSNS